jgi:hypothetical protein
LTISTETVLQGNLGLDVVLVNHSDEPATHTVVSLFFNQGLGMVDARDFKRALCLSDPTLGDVALQEWRTVINEHSFSGLPVFRGCPLALARIPPLALQVPKTGAARWTIGWRVLAPHMEPRGRLLILDTSHPFHARLWPHDRNISEVVG